MKNVHKGLVAQSISDLVLKEIYGIYETKNFTKEQIKKYKMTERMTKMFEKADNLWIKQKKLMKTFMSQIMSWLPLLNVAEVKKRDERNVNGLRKKSMIPESEISKRLE